MTLDQVMSELAALGRDSIKRVLLRHGAKEPFFGMRITDLKPIHRKLQGDQSLAWQLYATGNADAQYLAAKIVDGAQLTLSPLTRAQLQRWADTAPRGTRRAEAQDRALLACRLIL